MSAAAEGSGRTHGRVGDGGRAGDPVYGAFLTGQLEAGRELAASSDILTLDPVFSPLEPPPAVDGTPVPNAYRASFRCRGLVRSAEGAIETADRFEVGIRFPHDYLRRAEPAEILTWLGPRNVWHPNISDRAPFICVGHVVPGTPLVDLLYQCFEVITYHRVTPREDDALNRAACAWARHNRDRFPLDDRPLKRVRRPGEPT